MKRRKFLKNSAAIAAGAVAVPYILPSGRLFAATGSRVANHVVYVLFAGGIRNQEAVEKMYLTAQGAGPSGNVMNNMLSGARPMTNLVYNPWTPILSTPLDQQGTLFKYCKYAQGPTGHYNGHTVCMTGHYTSTGLNLNINPEFPTVFEYYRKHSDPAKSAINAWWLSEGLGPYPSLNYSSDPLYGPQYGANYMRAGTVFGDLGVEYFSDVTTFHPEDLARMNKVKNFLDNNFNKAVDDIPGIQNTEEDREAIKQMKIDVFNNPTAVDLPLPSGVGLGQLNGDLLNIAAAWHVMERFHPELMVVNTTNLDVCHSNFSAYITNLHKADYGVGWLWDKIQSDPVLQNDTIMICIPEHGRNLQPNTLADTNGLFAYDHTSDENSRDVFALIVGPPDKVNQGQVLGSSSNPVGESIDIVPTIANILGFDTEMPSGLLPGRVLSEAFV